MFDAIKKAIWGRHDDDPKVVSSHQVTEKGQIVSLLVQAFKAHTLLNASFSQEQTLYSTTLLGIYEEYGFIVLDEINPHEGHEMLQEKGEALLSGRVDGVEMRFRSRLMEVREKNGVAFYKMELPNQIYFLQRRKDYRIPTRGVYVPFRAHINYPSQIGLDGYVSDMSRSGVGVTINSLADLGKGDILPTCRMTIPSGADILFSMKVCFVWRDTSRGITRIGGSFQNIDHSSLQKIRKTLNQMERAMAKRLHGT